MTRKYLKYDTRFVFYDCVYKIGHWTIESSFRFTPTLAKCEKIGFQVADS